MKLVIVNCEDWGIKCESGNCELWSLSRIIWQHKSIDYCWHFSSEKNLDIVMQYDCYQRRYKCLSIVDISLLRKTQTSSCKMIVINDGTIYVNCWHFSSEKNPDIVMQYKDLTCVIRSLCNTIVINDNLTSLEQILGRLHCNL